MTTEIIKVIDFTGYKVPEHNLPLLIQTAYALSSPQGLGMLAYEGGPMPERDVQDILSRPDARVRLSMDYALGRSVKLAVVKDREEHSYLKNEPWYDHSEKDRSQLLTELGIDPIVDLWTVTREVEVVVRHVDYYPIAVEVDMAGDEIFGIWLHRHENEDGVYTQKTYFSLKEIHWLGVLAGKVDSMVLPLSDISEKEVLEFLLG